MHPEPVKEGEPGNMQPIRRPNIPDDLEATKNFINYNINRNPLEEDLTDLANKNMWFS